MDFLDISSLSAAYRYAIKIEQKFNHQNKQEFGSANPQQSKYDKDNPNKQSPENPSKPQEKKGHGKTKKDIRKWCDFQTLIQNLILKILVNDRSLKQTPLLLS